MSGHGFHGGLRLDKHTEAVIARPIQQAAPSAVLALSLQQHRDLRLQACVRIGESVQAGQVVARPDLDIGDTRLGAWLHAPCDGEIIGLESRPLIQQPNQSGPHLLLRVCEGSTPASGQIDATTAAESLPAMLAQAGLSGLGGANFPSADKLLNPVDTLILNGAECEPWIACDEGLLIESAALVIEGAQVLARACAAQRIEIALESHMARAIDAVQAVLQQATGADGVPLRLHCLPSRYPQGSARQLIEALTGKQVPVGQHSAAVGVVVYNVGTAHAAALACRGQALTHRIVTVSGPGVREPGNYRVALGSSVADVIASAGGYTAQARRLLIGGPLMGVALPHDDFALQKGSNCVLVLDQVRTRDATTAQPCIRCGDCAEVCPARLSPQLLWQSAQARRPEQARADGVQSCIECGLCDLVCPSQIDLTRQFHDIKHTLWLAERKQQQANSARQRFEQRTLRLQREAQALEAKRASAGKEALSASVVAAAIAKAKARRLGKPADDEGESAT